MAEKHIDLGLTALDELFMTEEGRQENRLPRIRQIPLDMIDDMPDHPFKVRRDDDMELLIESVRDHGVITPILVRQKEDGRYETAAGHRRRMASKINGLTTIPAEVREMTRDEAIIIMCESNLQRTKILPSEKAFSYRMRLEAMKRQAGRPRKDNSVPLGQNFGQTTREAIAENSPDSNTQIQRYIRLTGDFRSFLMQIAEYAVNDNLDDYVATLTAVKGNSLLEELDELNTKQWLRQTLISSVGYMLMTRCGLDANELYTFEDFAHVLDFNTHETIGVLCVAASDISEMVLREIEVTVRAIQREEKSNARTFANREENRYHEDRKTKTERRTDHETDLYNAGRLSAPEPGSTGGTESGQVWNAAAQLSFGFCLYDI